MVSEDTALKVTMVSMAIATADATFLTYLHYQVKQAEIGGVCIELPGVGCGSVLASEYSEIYGIPLAVMGLVGFVLILSLSTARFLYRDRGFTKIFRESMLLLAAIGVAIGIYCTYLELFVLFEICPYCLLDFILMMLSACILFYTYAPLIRLYYGEKIEDEIEIEEWSPEEE